MSEIALNHVVNISLTSLPSGLSLPNINTIGLFTEEQPGWVNNKHAYKLYKNAQEVAVDYGTYSESAKQATAIFAQNPNVLSTQGYLVCIPFKGTSTPAKPAIITGTSSVDVTGIVVSTDYKIKINGISFSFLWSSAPSTAQAVLDKLNNDSGFSKLFELTADNPTNATATFTLKSKKEGASIALILETMPGVENSKNLGLVLTMPAEVPAYGESEKVDNESLEAAIQRSAGFVHYTGILTTQTLSDTALISASDYVQTLDKLLFYGSYNATDVTGVFASVQSKSNTHTRCLLYMVGEKAVEARIFAAAYASRALSTNFSGNHTTETMHLKSLATIMADTHITENILYNCEVAGVDVYGSFRGIPAIYSTGGNVFFDNIYNGFWFKSALEVELFNFLRRTNTKVPQTESGLFGLKNTAGLVCRQGVLNGYIGAGAWGTTSPTFGTPQIFRENIEKYGYYIYTLPISQQSQSERAQRKAPLLQIAIKTAGAIHSIDAIVTVEE